MTTYTADQHHWQNSFQAAAWRVYFVLFFVTTHYFESLFLSFFTMKPEETVW